MLSQTRTTARSEKEPRAVVSQTNHPGGGGPQPGRGAKG